MKQLATLLLSALLAASATASAAENGAAPATLERLPAAVRVTLQNESVGGKIETITEETRTGRLLYVAVILKNGRETTIRVSRDGAVVERQVFR